MRFTLPLPVLLACASPSLFAVFNPGSIGGQEGWSGGGGGTVSPLVDQAMVANDGNFANGAFRISNSIVNGNHNSAFGGWVHSPALGVKVGQPTSGAGADSMSVSFYLKTVSSTADGSNMDFCITNVADTNRNIFFSIENDTDAKNGLKFRTQEPVQGPTLGFSGAVDAFTAQNLSRNTWHFIEIVMTTVNGGPENDTFNVSLNGNQVLTGIRTFEESASEGGTYIISDGLMIRSGRTGSGVDSSFTNLQPQGYLIDDLTIKSFDASAPGTTLSSYSTDFTVVPEPATWAALAGVGALALALRRRRRS